MSAQTDQLTQDVANLTGIVTGLQTAFTAIAAAMAALQAAASNPNPDISDQLTNLETAINNGAQVLAQAQSLASPAAPPAAGGDTTSGSTTTAPVAGA